MKLLKRRAGRLPNYVRRFGIFDGIRLLFENERALPVSSSQARAFSIPGYENPIYLRDCVSDHAIFWQCIVQRQYAITHLPHSVKLMAAYASVLAAGDVPLIIDCGGNIGLSAIWFATQFPKARICVVEPDEANFDVLQKNVAPFGARMLLVRGGVWSRSCHLDIANPLEGAAAFRVIEADRPLATSIAAYTIDDLCDKAGVQYPLIVKMDVEGAQQNIFQRHTEWLARTALVSLELDDWLFPWQGTSTAFFKAMSKYDFDYLLSGESIFCFNHNWPLVEKTSKQQLTSDTAICQNTAG